MRDSRIAPSKSATVCRASGSGRRETNGCANAAAQSSMKWRMGGHQFRHRLGGVDGDHAHQAADGVVHQQFLRLAVHPLQPLLRRGTVVVGNGEQCLADECVSALQHVLQYAPGSIDPWGVNKPLVVLDMCWTAGIEQMLNADLVIAADNARFAHLEVLRGILASASGYRNAQLSMRDIAPPPAGEPIGHMGYFRAACRPLWDESLDWLLLSGQHA